MTFFQMLAILLCISAIGGFLNYKYLRLPETIGQLSMSLAASLLLIFMGKMGILDITPIQHTLLQLNFSDILLHGMLSVLLFAGALHINLSELKDVRWAVAVLATVGVIIATFVTGTCIWYMAGWLGFDLPYIYALLFGALISPTDPIAVLAILKQAGASRKIYVKTGGESLFNDGVGVVVFLAILGIATGSSEFSISALAGVFLHEALGGAVLGGLLGWACYQLLKAINEYKVELMLTLALATGGYALAEYLHLSAPICMVVAGLVIGNHGRARGMSEQTRLRLDDFWELLDEVLNALLFMLIGFELIIINLTASSILFGVLAIAAVLLGRFISVALPVSLLSFRTPFERGTIPMLTWGGLRGGISVALALSLPAGAEKDLILPITYTVVVFSILVQGLSFKKLIARYQ